MFDRLTGNVRTVPRKQHHAAVLAGTTASPIEHCPKPWDGVSRGRVAPTGDGEEDSLCASRAFAL
jgi:hypothetical protein